jgi:glycosyltransferase involved in cell wall biosynthesis
VVNCHIPQFEAVIICLWAKLLKKKIVLTHHCDLSSWPGIVNQITEKATAVSLFISGLLADKIVTYTKDYAKHSNYLERFKDKLVYLLPPVKLEGAEGNSGIKKAFSRAKYRIGFAGRIAQEKGIEYLLASIPLLKEEFKDDFKLFLAGPGKEVVGGGFKDGIRKSAERHKDYVVFLGPLSRGEMTSFYGMLDVLVLPSTQRLESFGFVQVEAMLSGCPVVASNLPGVRIPVKLSGMGETFPVADVKALAKSIVEVVRHRRDYIKQKGEIRRVFNYTNSIEGYEKLYKSIS